MKPVVSFLSDFGLQDAYVAQVKAVLMSTLPDVSIVDITHEISSYSVLSGAWLLFTTYRYFPGGSIHLAVVDPGVGTERVPLLVSKDGHKFIGPDNGIFSFLYPADEVIEVTWRPSTPLSHTFHGRDLFAPLIAQVINEPVLQNLGIARINPISLDIETPQVVHIDKFGNIITNIGCDKLRDGCEITINGKRIHKSVKTFSDIKTGEVALLCGSASTVEIVSNQGNAELMLNACVGMPVRLRVL